MAGSTRFGLMRKLRALCYLDSTVPIWEACVGTDMEASVLHEGPVVDRIQVVLYVELVDHEDLDEWVATFVEVDSGYLECIARLERQRGPLRPDSLQTCKHPFSYRNQEE